MLLHESSCAISAVTRVIANTNTRSKNSSSGVTRCSVTATTLLIVMYGPGLGHVEHAPAGVVQAAAEIDLVRADPLDLGGRVAAHEQCGGRSPVDLADPRAV